MSDLIESLCPTCGLCCNGSLFVDVALEKHDDLHAIVHSGLGLHKKGKKTVFSQPCNCFDGQRCEIYSNRPMRCRAFECGVLTRVAKREISVAKGRSTIQKAQRHVAVVVSLLEDLGETARTIPLRDRYALAMTKPVDLAGGPRIERHRSRLLVEMGKLMGLLQRDFLG